MDYDLSFVSSNGEDISKIISSINEVKELLLKSNEKMINNWVGLSYNNYIDGSNRYIVRCDEKIDELSSIINLLGLIAKHNNLRSERESCYSKIAALRPYEYETKTDEDGKEYKVLNVGVHNQIVGLYNRINEINEQMNVVISSIRSITGG